ncbi:hypothetical protein MSAN_00868500 [Mycena sanguinolenta]|uniref:DUF6534 domain-containing protein n=1 Tax=Mycena sanguinolenta TaxID=230812 RepID=A0A8H6YZG4_9AGAR|nr:hypothetical protein MSAN_00868500 [Mycena sanguinolenta]
MSTSTGATFDVRLSYGPLLLGIFFNLILYGILICQQYQYFQDSRTTRDPTLIRILAWALFVIETANTAFDMSMIYEPLILHFGEAPNKLPTVFVTQPLCVVLVGFPVQLFFIWRIYAVTKNNILAGGILLCSLASFGGGVWTTVLVPMVATFPRIPLLYRSAEVWLIASAATDIAIASVLAYTLSRKKTGWGETDTVVNRLILMTVQTGMLTALFSILDVACFLTLRGETVNFFFNIALSKIYANTLMSTLNARKYLKRVLDAQPGISWGGIQVVQEQITITDVPASIKRTAKSPHADEGESHYQIRLNEMRGSNGNAA